MGASKKEGRYKRIFKQYQELIGKCKHPLARMATLNALLHHKMDHFFWTGFYLLNDGQLQVGPYQGSLACMELKKGTGVCWAAVHTAEPVIVDDVHAFPGHIACDARSKSEITVPLKDLSGKIVAVLDIDSDIEANFDQVDAIHLKELIGLIYS